MRTHPILHPRTSTVTIAAALALSLLLPIPSSAQTPPPARPQPGEEVHEGSEVRVTITRGDRRIEDIPLRVEVIGEEEIEEKTLMRPGTIAMLLAETAGLRVQESAPALGGASVRVQGLRGRYTRILVDGLPLYGADSGSLALLQIPPMDLRQVEVVKGAASALYGASALGGVVNLVSRRPSEEGERELLLNATTRGGTDALAWISEPVTERWGFTALAGIHRQPRTDVTGDGWSDLPGFRRVTLRPRLFGEDGEGRRTMVTMGGMLEERSGGGAGAHGGPGIRRLDTRRLDGGAVRSWRPVDGLYLDLRFSGSRTVHRSEGEPPGPGGGGGPGEDTWTTWMAEAALRGDWGRHAWVAGTAVSREAFSSRTFPDFDHVFGTLSIFAQDEIRLWGGAALALSARGDHHDEYGSFLSPRASLLLRPGQGGATLRLSGGTGYHAPTPFVEETQEVGLSRLVPLEGLRAERARSASADAGWKGEHLEGNATLFGSTVRDAVAVAVTPEGALRLENLRGEVRTWGTELLLRLDAEPLVLTLFHTHIRAHEPEPEGGSRRRPVPLTPRHQAGLVAAFEEHGAYRVGLELYRVGVQVLEDNPFRGRSRPYWLVGVQGERRFGRIRLFANLENLGDTRQTRWDPLLLPAPDRMGRWTTELWAPLEGRIFNGGVRVEF